MKTKDEVLETARELVKVGGPPTDMKLLKLAGMQLAVLLEIRDLLAERPNVTASPTRVKVQP